MDANQPMLRISGEVDSARSFSLAELDAIEGEGRIEDVSRLDAARRGVAVSLARLLKIAGVRPSAVYIGLHASADNFHASIPLAPILDSAVVIYRLGDGPLPSDQGGPVRLFIPDVAACHSAEIDECASVKHLDQIELTSSPGRDNRPHDDREHEELHRRQTGP